MLTITAINLSFGYIRACSKVIIKTRGTTTTAVVIAIINFT